MSQEKETSPLNDSTLKPNMLSLSNSKVLTLKKDDVIMVETDIFYVSVGLVAVFHTSASAEKSISQIVGRGGIINLRSVLGKAQETERENQDQLKRLSVGATLIKVPLREYMTAMANDTSFKIATFEQIGALLDENTEYLSYLRERPSVTNRLSRFLVEMYKYIDPVDENSSTLLTGLTRDAIASHIGVSREIIGRILKELENKNIVNAFGAKKIQINDLKALKFLAIPKNGMEDLVAQRAETALPSHDQSEPI